MDARVAALERAQAASMSVLERLDRQATAHQESHEEQTETLQRAHADAMSTIERLDRVVTTHMESLETRTENQQEWLTAIGVDMARMEDRVESALHQLSRRPTWAEDLLTDIDEIRQRLAEGRSLDLAGAEASVSPRIDADEKWPTAIEAEAVVDVTTDVGPLYLHRSDKVMTPWIEQYRSWERAEAAFLRDRLSVGSTFVDVGANIGYFTVLAAQLVGRSGRVIAVEPDVENLRLLRANLWRNGCRDVRILPVAAFEQTGFQQFVLEPEHRGNQRLDPRQSAAKLVPTARLDELSSLRPLVDTHLVIKVDVQGLDHVAVESLAGVISRARRAILLVEYTPASIVEYGADPDDVLANYAAMGLRVHVLDTNGQPEDVPLADVRSRAETSESGFINLVLTREVP